LVGFSWNINQQWFYICLKGYAINLDFVSLTIFFVFFDNVCLCDSRFAYYFSLALIFNRKNLECLRFLFSTLRCWNKILLIKNNRLLIWNKIVINIIIILIIIKWVIIWILFFLILKSIIVYNIIICIIINTFSLKERILFKIEFLIIFILIKFLNFNFLWFQIKILIQ
jgi:hypothetical protein